MPTPQFDQLNIVAADLDATIAFYRLLGIDMHDPVRAGNGEPFHAASGGASGPLLEADSPRFARVWNDGWQETDDLAGRVVIGLRVADRAEVDRLADAAAQAGHRILQPAHDAFWGARYAIVEDPDGIAVGIMSAADETHRSPPPEF